MTPVSRRSAARGAAWGSGGLAGAVAASMGVLVAQARLARKAIGPQRGVPPYQDGRFGPATGTSIRLAVIGDSAAAGLGGRSTVEKLERELSTHGSVRPITLHAGLASPEVRLPTTHHSVSPPGKVKSVKV